MIDDRYRHIARQTNIVMFVDVYLCLDRSTHLFVSDQSNFKFDKETKILLLGLYTFFAPVD